MALPKGFKHTIETKRKISEAQKIIMKESWQDLQYRQKMSKARKGRVAWNKGLTKETDKRVKQQAINKRNGINKICSFCGNDFYVSGCRKNKAKFCSYGCYWEDRIGKYVGENSGAWKGGTTSLYDQIRTCSKNLKWIKGVFERDNYTCQKCGDNKGGNLNAHHIKYFGKIIEKYKIKTFEQALECEELWNINNGRTLCKKCHIKIHKT